MSDNLVKALNESCTITIEKENSKVQISYEDPNGTKNVLNMNEDVDIKNIQVKVPSSIFITGVSLINNYDGTKKLSIGLPSNLIISGYGATPRMLNVYNSLNNKYSDSLNVIVEVVTNKDSKIIISGVGSQLEPPTGKELDVVIVAGQSNSVCYSGSNGASLDVQVPEGVFEYRPSKEGIQKFENPIGEEPSNSGVIKGYSTGGTWFSSMCKTWKEKTGRNICIIPCGDPNGELRDYYPDGSKVQNITNKWNSFKKWYEKQDRYTLGHVMMIWHGGESGTGDNNPINDALKVIFDNIKSLIPEVEQVFFSRLSNSDFCSNDQTKRYNDLLIKLSNESNYIMIHSNCMKYYWLNHYSDEYNYDQYANNDLGRSIGDNLVKYYSTGKLRINTRAFEIEQGKYDFNEFSGINIVENRLCRFSDTITDKNWALLSKLYNSYAKINPVALKNNGKFKMSFTCFKGDKEGTDFSPILAGGNGHISINNEKIEITDGYKTVLLHHGTSPYIDRSGNITKDPIRHKFDIELVGANLILKIDDLQRDIKPLPLNFNGNYDSFGYMNGIYFEGVIGEFNIDAEDGTSSQEELPKEPFKYIDKVKKTRIVDPKTLNKDGHLVVSPRDDVNSNLINKKLVLTTDTEWEIQVECMPTVFGVNSLFTLFGIAKYEQDNIVSIQIGDNQIRLYNVSEGTHIDTWEENTGVPFRLGQKHIVKIASDGKGNIYYNCDGSVVYGIKLGARKHIVSGSKFGDSVIGGVLMDHSGEFYSVKIVKVPTILNISTGSGGTVNIETLDKPETEKIIEKYKGYIDAGEGTFLPENMTVKETESLIDKYKNYSEPESE